MASSDIKTTHDNNPTGCDDINSDYYFQVVKDNDGTLSDEGMSVPQMRAVLQQVGPPPVTDVFSMTLAFDSLNAIIGPLFGNYTHWQITKSATPPIYTDGNWKAWPMPTVYAIATEWTAAILQPQTYYLYVKNTEEVLTIAPSQTVTAQTNRAVPQTPNDVTFNAQTNVPVDTLVFSNTVGISGLLAPTAITVSNGAYSKNGSAYTALAGVISNGDNIRLRVLSSSNDSELKTCTVNLGLRVETFDVTTAASGDSAGVISIVSATYEDDEDAGPIAITLRVTGKVGTITVGCRVSTLYDPAYHTAVEDVNYTGKTAEVVQWTDADTSDKTVNIVLNDQNESYNNIGELIIDSGSEFGGATIDTDLDATLFKINGTGGSATPSWQQQGASDYIVKVQAEHANNTIVPKYIGGAWHEWVADNKDSRDCISSGFGMASKVIPGYSSTNPYIIMPVNFTETGTHYVHLSVLGYYSTPDCIPQINTTESSSAFDYPSNSAWSWQNDSGYSLNVPSTGVHEVRIYMTDEQTFIDAIILTTNASYDAVTNGDGESDSTWSTGASGDNPDNPIIPQGPPPIVDDKTPDPFAFGELVEQPLSTSNIVSIAKTIIGINVPTEIAITSDPSGTAEYQIDGGSWVTSAGTISAGSSVVCRLDSSGSNSTTVTMDLKIGTVTESFSVTTIASGSVGLTPQTSTVVVSSNSTTVEDLDINIAAGNGPGIHINNGITGTKIRNCRITSVDSHAIEGVAVGTVEMHDLEISNCWGSAVYLYGFASFNGYDNTIENVHSGFDLWNGGQGNITIQDNWIKNMFSRPSGVASKNAVNIGLRFCSGPNILIHNNICINEVGKADSEDKISIYASSGTAASFMTITNNKLRGTNDSTSCSTIIVGDDGGNYTLTENNIIVNAGQTGLGVPSQGHDHTARGNQIFCEPLYKLSDPSIGVSNVGMAPGYTAWAQSLPVPYNIVIEDNDMTFWKSANYNGTGGVEVLTPYWFPDTSYFGPQDIAGWSTNRFDTSSSQPANLTADIWDTDWDIRPVRIT